MSLLVNIPNPFNRFLVFEQQLRQSFVELLGQEQTASENTAEGTALDFVETVPKVELIEVEL